MLDFLYYAALFAALFAACATVAWFFPPLRSAAGAIVVAAGAALYAYRKGEKDQKASDKTEQPQQPQQQQPDRWPSLFPWDWGR